MTQKSININIMLILLPISENDFKKSLNVFAFIRALRHFGPYDRHELLVVTKPSDIMYGRVVFDEVKNLFAKSNFHEFASDGDTGWPLGPNFYWKETINYLKSIKNELPWFWMELDITPVKPNWADILEDEYYKCEKPCLGLIENTTTITRDHYRVTIARHVQGTAVYHATLHEYCSVWKYIDQINQPFDVMCSWELVPETANTKLIQQGFRTLNYKFDKDYMIIKGEDNGDFGGQVTYDQPLDPLAVVHHGCKDHTLAEIVISDDYNMFLNHHKVDDKESYNI